MRVTVAVTVTVTVGEGVGLLGWVLRMAVEGGFFNYGFGDLLGELVELPEVAVSVGVGVAAATGGSMSRVCRGLTAFIIHFTQQLQKHAPLSLSLKI